MVRKACSITVSPEALSFAYKKQHVMCEKNQCCSESNRNGLEISMSWLDQRKDVSLTPCPRDSHGKKSGPEAALCPNQPPGSNDPYRYRQFDFELGALH
jgi:hypothetical protein